MSASKNDDLEWYGCFDVGWEKGPEGDITAESFSHPAKANRGVLYRLFDHMKDHDWIKRGDTVFDPFGGIGTTGIVGTRRGMKVVSIELEPGFVKFARDNFEMHRRKWEQEGLVLPVMIQGDSRNLIDVLKSADVVISSPPYGETVKGDGTAKETAAESTSKRRTPGGSLGQSQRHQGYGETEGQLGAMPMGSIDAIVTSPGAGQAQTGGGINERKVIESGGKVIPLGNTGYNAADIGYSEGQLSTTMEGKTFWEAYAKIMKQCFDILKPNGHMILLTRNFIRDGERIPFSDTCVEVCEKAGFRLVCRHRAMMVVRWVEETFSGPVEKEKSNKSFFRKNYENKGGLPIDWEDVLCFVKPAPFTPNPKHY